MREEREIPQESASAFKASPSSYEHLQERVSTFRSMRTLGFISGNLRISSFFEFCLLVLLIYPVVYFPRIEPKGFSGQFFVWNLSLVNEVVNVAHRVPKFLG